MSDYGRLLEENIALRAEVERLKARIIAATGDLGNAPSFEPESAPEEKPPEFNG